jgi:hypothetical protein
MQTRVWSQRSGAQNPGKPSTLVENPKQEMQRDLICGLLQDMGEQQDGHHYKVVSNGTIWVYTTDCNGTVDSGFQYVS